MEGAQMKLLDGLFGPWSGGIGWPGMAGIALLVAAGAFYVATLLPQQARLQELRSQSHRQRQAAQRPESEAPIAPAQKLAAFYGLFPAHEALPDLLEAVYGAARKQALVLEQGEYRPIKDTLGDLVRYQVTLPVRGTYPQIRKFVDGALAGVRTLSLESIQFERQKVGDPAVEAKVRFVVYLGNKS
jgi:Tfp pilus assembly protein PilO